MATKDRLEDLKKAMGGQRVSIVINENEIAPPPQHSNLTNIESTRKLLEKLEEITKECKYLFNHEPFSTEMHGKLKVLFQSSQETGIKIARALKLFRDDLESLPDKSAISYRMKNVHYTSFCQRYKDALIEHENLSQKMQDVRNDFIVKCNRIVNNGEPNEESLEQLIEQDTGAIFAQDYLTMEKEARQMLCDLNARKKELLLIENHLFQIKELFTQLAVLIEQQQESVNRIEYHAMSAVQYVDNTTQELKTTVKLKRRSLKCKVIVISVIILILLVVIGTLLA